MKFFGIFEDARDSNESGRRFETCRQDRPGWARNVDTIERPAVLIKSV
ncbi:hypothetical protein BSU04_01495 [Caballeronia sordidicola]|uniref:Uncharacterized protein n=1 Tax=Caballeronia sordidicola TaxID=196367 RepID=A0A226XAG9_CABSO|nr:hypothetical protein BSU04_01495 [Caballeronia sordidicola]